MSHRAPRVTADEIIQVSGKMGFVLAQQSGSHKIHKNSTANRVTTPYRKAKVLHFKASTIML